MEVIINVRGRRRLLVNTKKDAEVILARNPIRGGIPPIFSIRRNQVKRNRGVILNLNVSGIFNKLVL